MYQQFNRYKILQVFFDSPNKKYQLRELLNQGLIQEIKGGIYKGYKSSFSSLYKILKRNDLLFRLEESGLIKDLEKFFTPNCIVLYGSALEGTDDLRGDIDIFVQSSKKEN